MDWIKCIASRLLSAVRREAGVTLIEMVVAIAIFGIASIAIIGVLTSATAADGLSRQRSIALELAQQEVEYVRQLNYTDVGIQGANPPGVVVATQMKAVAGLLYTLKTRIRWVTDSIPSSFASSANYKQIRVTVTRNTDNKQLARVFTYVSSSSRAPYGGVNNAIINVTANDYALKTALQNVAVSLNDGPENTSDVTDETGVVTFPALTPNPTSGSTAYYDITAGLTGYQTLREDLPPATQTGTGPTTAAHVQVAPSQTLPTTIYLYLPVIFNIQINNSNGTAYTGTADVDVGQNLPSLRSAQDFSLAASSSGFLSVPTLSDDLGLEWVVPGAAYLVGVRAPHLCTSGCSFVAALSPVQLSQPDGYPTTLQKSFVVTLPSSPNVATTKPCTVTVQMNNSPYTKLPNARVDVDDGVLGTVAPNIYFTGTTNGSGTFSFNVPAQSDYDFMARSGSMTGNQTNQVVPSSGSCAFTVKVS